MCSNNIVRQNNCISEGSSDSSILLMGNCYANTLSDNIVHINNTKRGVYINTSRGNFVYNNTVYNAKTAIAIGFSFGGNIVNGVNGFNCVLLFSSSYSRHDIMTNGHLISNIHPAESVYTELGISIVNSADILISNIITKYPKASPNKNGRFHIYQSVGITFDNIVVDNTYIWYSTNTDTDKYPTLDRFTIKNSNVDKVILKGTTEYLKHHKRDKIINTKINGGLIIQHLYDSSFINCDISGDVALNIQESAMFNDFIGCSFIGNTYDIKFGEDGVRNQLSSLQYFKDCKFTKTIGYDVTAFDTIETQYPPFRQGQRVSILYPKNNPFNCVYHDKWYIENRISELKVAGVIDSNLTLENKGMLAIRDGILQYWDGSSWRTVKLE